MIRKCDIFNIETEVNPGSVDLIIYDPPYGIGDKKLAHKEKRWKKTDEEWDVFSSIDDQYQFYLDTLALLLPLLKKTGSMFVFGSFHSIFLVGEILQRQLGAKIINSIVWYKLNAMFNISRRSLVESTEQILWATPKGNNYYFDYDYSRSINCDRHQLRNVWESSKTPVNELCGHPHQKPLWLIHRLIKLACPAAGFVVDPMCGSATTEIVCCSMGIESLSSDVSDEYLKIARDRLNREVRSDMYCRGSKLK